MRKYLYLIRKLKIKPWLKYWLIKAGEIKGVLSEILTGTSFTLENSIERVFNKFDLKGNTLQDGTPSPESPVTIQNVSGDNTIKIQNKNLFDWNYSKNSTNTQLTEYRICEISGLIPNSDYNINNMSFTSGIADTYIYLWTEKNYSTSIRTAIMYSNYAYNTKVDFTSNNEGKIYLAIYPNDTTTWENILNTYFKNAQIEQGSTATDYIAHAEQNLPINLKSENLFDYNSYTYDKTIFNAYRFIEIKNTKPSTSYTIYNYDDLTQSGFENVLLAHGPSYSDISFANLVGVSSRTFTTRESGKVYLCTYASSWNEEKWNNFISYFENAMFVEGTSTATPYESYYNYELSKIGTAEDYFYKENDKWYLHKETINRELIGDNTVTWNYNNGCFQAVVFGNQGDIDAGFCNNYKYNSTHSGITGALQNNEFGWNTSKQLTIKDTRFSTIDAFKSNLATLKTNGTPVILYYVKSTPTNTEITETTLINQLEALRQAKSYNEQTTISQANDDLPFIIDLQYWKEEGE